MCSITSTGSTPTSVPAPSTTDNPIIASSQANGQPAAYYLDLVIARRSAETLGITLPSSPADTAAIMANLMMLLDKTTAETRNNREVSLTSRFRTGLGAIAEAFARIGDLTKRYADLSARLAEDVSARDGYIEDRDRLRAAANEAYIDIRNIDQSIAFIEEKIATSPHLTESEVRSLLEEKQNLQIQKAAKTHFVEKIDIDIADIEEKILLLDSDIEKLNDEIGTTKSLFLLSQFIATGLFGPLYASYYKTASFENVIENLEDNEVADFFEEISENLKELKSFDLTGVLQSREEGLPSESGRVRNVAIAIAAGIADSVAVLRDFLDLAPADPIDLRTPDENTRLRLQV